MVVNPGKNEIIEAEGKEYRRLCIKTHVITDADKITDVVMQYAAPEMQEGDILFISEKAVACTQKRAIPMKDIKPRPLAKFLCKFVLKTPYGIGLGIPETMEMAIRECGTFRILLAAEINSVLGRPVLITDINDIGGVIMGEAPFSVDRGLMAAILRDNPLGQSHEQTPMGIIRPVA